MMYSAKVLALQTWRQYTYTNDSIYINDSTHYINEPTDSDSNYYMYAPHSSLCYHNLHVSLQLPPRVFPHFHVQEQCVVVPHETLVPGAQIHHHQSYKNTACLSGLNNSHVTEELIR